jgi:predicted secreted protein
MTWSLGLASYFLIWWILLFAVLPLAVRKDPQLHVEVVPGADSGAPIAPRLLRVVLINTLASAVIWALIDLAYVYYYVP